MICTEDKFRLSCLRSRWLCGVSETTWDWGRLWLLKKPTEPNHEQNPKAIFLKNFSLILNSSFSSWGHLSYGAAGLCVDKQRTREAEKICPLLHQWRENVCLMTSGEPGVFLLDLMKKFEFHFTVGTLPVVWVCRHLQHHVFFDTKLSFSSAEARQNLIWFHFCNYSPDWGNGVWAQGEPRALVPTLDVPGHGAERTHSHFPLDPLYVAAHCSLPPGGSCWFKFPFRCFLKCPFTAWLILSPSLPCHF